MNQQQLQRQRAQGAAVLHTTLLQNTRTTAQQLYLSLAVSVACVVSAPAFVNGYRLLPFVIGTAAAASAVTASNSHIRNKQMLAGADAVAERRLLDELNDGYNNDRLALVQPDESEPEEELEYLTSLREYWLAQDKHLMLIAPTGAGKSRMIQALAQELQQHEPWDFSILDIDASVEDWQWLGVEAVVNDIASVVREMGAEVEEQEEELTRGKQLGWSKLKSTKTPKFTVLEEAPAISLSHPNELANYMTARAIRGRKARMFFCVVAQTDDVESVGMKNKSQLRDQCFVRVYLGDAAIARARYLKQPKLVEALVKGKWSVCLVDDVLCSRPQLGNNSTSQVLPNYSGKKVAEEVAEVAESYSQQGFQLTEATEVSIRDSHNSTQNGNSQRSTSVLRDRPAWTIYDDLSDEAKAAVQALLPRCSQAEGDLDKLMQLIAEASPKSKSQLGRQLFGVSGGDAFAHVSVLWKDLS